MKKKLLMVLGPTEVEEDILKISAQTQDYMRTEDYSNKWKGIFENLKYVFQTKNTVRWHLSGLRGIHCSEAEGSDHAESQVSALWPV